MANLPDKFVSFSVCPSNTASFQILHTHDCTKRSIQFYIAPAVETMSLNYLFFPIAVFVGNEATILSQTHVHLKIWVVRHIMMAKIISKRWIFLCRIDTAVVPRRLLHHPSSTFQIQVSSNEL